MAAAVQSRWNPSQFSNVRVATERRYVPTHPSAPLPDNDSANAGQVNRRPGERVSGWQRDDAVDLLDALPKGGITDEELQGHMYTRASDELAASAAIRRGDVAGIGRDETGAAAAFLASNIAAAGGVRGTVKSAGNAGAVPAASTAALWGGGVAQQQPTASVGRQEAYPRGAMWQTTDKPTPLAQGTNANTYIQDYGVASVPEFGAANRGRTALTHYDERVGVNGMADFNEYEGAYPEGDLGMGAPRRLDLGIMVEHASDTLAWRGLTTKGNGPGVAMTGKQMTGNQSGRGVAGDPLARSLLTRDPASSIDNRWNDGIFGHGDGVDAVFVGVEVDPYTGVEYDMYENAAPAPQKDLRQRDSGKQRMFEAMMGGSAPGRPQRKKQEVENDWNDAYPDVDERDWVEYARLRSMEAARREDFFGPHADDAAWTDAEGYKSLPKGEMPAGKVGYNDAVRFLPLPALHLHGGLIATPMTGGGIDPGPGSGVPGAGFMPPQIAVRVKRAPVFSVHGGIGGEHVDGPGTGGLAEQRDPLRAPVRIGQYGEQFTDGTAAGAEGAGTGGLAEQRDPLRAPVRIGRMGEQYTDGTAAGAEGVYMPPDVLTEQLSQRPQMVMALGRAFANIVTDVEGTAVPPQEFPEALRMMANNPLSFGRAIIDLGLTGPGTAGMADYSELKTPHRVTDMRAMAIGDVAMAMVSGLEGSGPYVPPEIQELTRQERDAVTLAVGRAILHMVDGAAVAGSAGPVGWTAPGDVDAFGTTMADTKRQPAFIEALGRLAIQLADDAGGMYVPPEDWAAAQSKDRVMPERSKVEAARQLGRHLIGIVSEVEGAGTGGLIQFRDPLRGDSIISAVLGRGIDAGVDGAGTSRLSDPDAVRKRKLDQYAYAIAARLYGLNANAEELGVGTAGMMEWTRRSRARNDVPNLRGSAPFRMVDGHDGLRPYMGELGNVSRIRNDPGPNNRLAGAQPGTETMPGAQPIRGEQWTRYGHRFGGAPVATHMDNYAGGGQSSAYQADYSEVDSKYMEVEQ